MTGFWLSLHGIQCVRPAATERAILPLHALLQEREESRKICAFMHTSNDIEHSCMSQAVVRALSRCCTTCGVRCESYTPNAGQSEQRQPLRYPQVICRPLQNAVTPS